MTFLCPFFTKIGSCIFWCWFIVQNLQSGSGNLSPILHLFLISSKLARSSILQQKQQMSGFTKQLSIHALLSFLVPPKLYYCVSTIYIYLIDSVVSYRASSPTCVVFFLTCLCDTKYLF